MFVDVHVDAYMRVVEKFLVFIYMAITCGKFHLLQGWFLRFHMRTHRRPADLAEVSQW